MANIYLDRGRVLQITDYWCFHALRILLFLHRGLSDQWIVHTNKQKKKREKYYSEVTLVLLHYSEHIEDTHFMWTWSHRPFHSSQTDWTGSNCYAQPHRRCRCLEPFWVCVVMEVCLTRVGLSHRPTYKFVSFLCFVAFEHKTHHTYASAEWINWLRTFNILT